MNAWPDGRPEPTEGRSSQQAPPTDDEPRSKAFFIVKCIFDLGILRAGQAPKVVEMLPWALRRWGRPVALESLAPAEGMG
ncbi:MAG: hypothetical protein ACLQM8_24265 [Limisphaerales bacterium]